MHPRCSKWHYFFLFDDWVIPHCVYHIFFIHPSVSGHLGYFHVLAIVECCNEHWGACILSDHAFLQMCVCAKRLQSCLTLWAVACQAPLSMGFSRQEYWSGNHALFQGTFPTQGLNLGLLYSRWILYHLSHQWSFSPDTYIYIYIYLQLYICLQILKLGMINVSVKGLHIWDLRSLFLSLKKIRCSFPRAAATN